MKLMAFTIYDKKTKYYTRPFFEPNQQTAMRLCRNMVNDKDAPNNNLKTNPEDFELYEIGEFDDETGALAEYSKIEFLCNLSDFVEE